MTQNSAGSKSAKVIWELPVEEIEWEELENNWANHKEDSVIDQIEKGRMGLNAGLDNGLVRINSYIHGTHRGRKILIGADSGVGKCLGKGTKVIMYDGTLKEVECVVAGDQLMGPDGTPRNVLSVCTGREQMYWVRQKRGIDYRVNENHILSCVYKPQTKWSSKILPNQQFISKSKRKRAYKLKESFPPVIQNISVRDYLKVTNKALYKGWKSPVSFGNKEVQLDPYFLGLWLGDGTSDGCEITTTEPEITDYLNSIVGIKAVKKDKITYRLKADRELHEIDPVTNVIIGIYKSVTDAASNYGVLPEYISRATASGKIVNNSKWVWAVKNNHILEALKHYNLLGNKHVPLDYIQASKECRKLLIAGLIDSDGYYNSLNGMVEIVQKNKQLADQVVFILRSLGFYTTITSKIATMKRSDNSIYTSLVYRIAFCHCSTIPCRVERKHAKKQSLKPLITGIKVEKDTIDDYYGFVIDGDRLFMLEDFTVTHNTTISDFMYVFSLWKAAKKAGIKLYIKYFSFEISTSEKKIRWVSQWIKVKYNEDLSSDYIIGRIPNKRISDEHLRMVMHGYAIVEEMMKDIEIIDHMLHPTGMLNRLIEDHYEKIGKVIRDTPKEGKAKGMIRAYKANDPTSMTVAITDHLALINVEKGAVTIKSIMDRWSMYGVQLRNIFGTTIVDIQQFSTSMMSTYRDMKKTEATIAPQRLDFGDSTYTYRDADLVLGLVKPLQFGLQTYHQFNMGILGQYFIALYLMKHRYGPSDRVLFQFMNPIAGLFYDMPDSAQDPNLKFYIEEAQRLEKLSQHT